ncbi:MAG: hypothetical protein RLZZ612_675 [Pseudomonadota bacterium]
MQAPTPELLEAGPDQVYRPVSDTPSAAGASAVSMGTRRPNLAFMARHPAHAIALGFGAGLARYAPGTVGTLWAWASFLVLQPWLNDVAWAVVIGVGFLLGIWACALTAKHMGEPDSSHMVWDEVVAFWLILWMIQPTGFWGQFGAFVLFRLLDAVKLGPMAWADERFKGYGLRGGFGVMLDDGVAAFCVLLFIAWWRY